MVVWNILKCNARYLLSFSNLNEIRYLNEEYWKTFLVNLLLFKNIHGYDNILYTQ